MKFTRIAAVAASVYVFAGAAVYSFRPLTGRAFIAFGDTLPVIASVFAFVCTLLAASRFEPRESQRLAWGFLGFGLFLWFLGEASWWLIEVALGQEVPFPSIADAF